LTLFHYPSHRRGERTKPGGLHDGKGVLFRKKKRRKKASDLIEERLDRDAELPPRFFLYGLGALPQHFILLFEGPSAAKNYLAGKALRSSGAMAKKGPAWCLRGIRLCLSGKKKRKFCGAEEKSCGQTYMGSSAETVRRIKISVLWNSEAQKGKNPSPTFLNRKKGTTWGIPREGKKWGGTR